MYLAVSGLAANSICVCVCADVCMCELIVLKIYFTLFDNVNDCCVVTVSLPVEMMMVSCCQLVVSSGPLVVSSGQLVNHQSSYSFNINMLTERNTQQL